MPRLSFTLAFRRRLFAALLLLGGTLLGSAPTLRAQTTDQNHPGMLSPGVNHGTLDSIAANQHFWMVWINPGKFEARFTHGRAQEFVNTGANPTFGCGVRPQSAGTITRETDRNNNLICHGTVTKRAYLLLQAIPPQGNLVRQTVRYDLEVTGSAVDYSGAPAPGTAVDNVAGVYKVFIGVVSGRQPYTMVKFLPNGQITSPEGFSGHWSLFDAASKTYSIQFDGHQITDVYQPGRGFADSSGNVDFQSVGH